MANEFQFYRKVSLYCEDEKLFSYSMPARQSRLAVLRTLKKAFREHGYATHAIVRKRDGSETIVRHPLGWRPYLSLLLTS